MTERMQKPVEMEPITECGTVNSAGESYHFDGTGYADVVMPKMDGIRKITGHFKVAKQQGQFGLMFNVGSNQTGSLNLVFDPAKQQVAFYNTDTSRVHVAKPELAVPVSLQPDESCDFTLLIDGTVAVLYIND